MEQGKQYKPYVRCRFHAATMGDEALIIPAALVHIKLIAVHTR